MHDRSVFFISDGTGITAETLGHLLGHFPSVNFRLIRIPFVDSDEKVGHAIASVVKVAAEDGVRPVVIATLIRPEWRERLLRETDALCLDVFSIFVDPLAEELRKEPTGELGKSRSVSGKSYYERMEAINFTLNHDDGITEVGLEEAHVILVGVSRCGKTPTCLYLAMQFGIKAANYPLIPEDLERGRLPDVLGCHSAKLFGLSIKPERLHSVRNERRPNSRYASLENCRSEIRKAEDLMQRAKVPWLDSTTRSIEEIATTILQLVNLPTTESYL